MDEENQGTNSTVCLNVVNVRSKLFKVSPEMHSPVYFLFFTQRLPNLAYIFSPLIINTTGHDEQSSLLFACTNLTYTAMSSVSRVQSKELDKEYLNKSSFCVSNITF